MSRLSLALLLSIFGKMKPVASEFNLVLGVSVQNSSALQAGEPMGVQGETLS